MTTNNTALDSAAAARVILARREAILATWCALCGMDPSEPGTDVVEAQADAVIVAFAGYLLGEDLSDSTMARHWEQMQPDRELLTSALTSMSLFPEALRASLDPPSSPALDLPALTRQAATFVQSVTRAIVDTGILNPGQVEWHRISQKLEEQRQRRVARLGALIDISRAVSTAGSLDRLFEEVRAQCARVMGADHFSIALYDGESRSLIPVLVYSQGERRRDIEGRPVPAGLSQIVARTREPMAVPDYVPACRANGVEPTPPFAGQERLAWMGAPMVQGGQTIGIISVFCPLLPFDRDDVELLAAIASQTAVAIENSRLLEAHRQRASQLKAIYQLARRIVTLREPDALLGTAVDLIHDLFGYATVSVFLTDPTCGDQVLRAHSNPAAEPDLLTLRIPAGGRGIVADVAASGQPAVVGDVRQDPRYLETPQTADTRSEMAVPIVLDDRILGVLDVQSPDLAAFDDHDLTTLRTIADQIAVALENARLFAEERERRKALELMLATTRAAGSSLVLDEVLQRVARGIAEAAGSATCALYLLDEDGRSFIPAAAVAAPNAPLDAAHLATTPLRLDEATLLGRLVTAPETVLCCRRSALGIGDPALERLLGPACCALAVPLSVKGRTLGLALIPAEQSEEIFTPERVRLIQGVADSVALAIENARLYVRSQGLAIAEERGRLAQEIHDGLAQGLTAISLQLDLADAYLPANPERAAEKVRRALELTRQNLDEARRSVLDLRAAHLHQVALPEALRRLAQRFSDETGIQAELLTEGLSGRLAARLEIGLYRIAEEALTNVRLHAGATRVRIALTADQRQVQFRVQDDGAGFDPARAKREKGAGFGLVAIRERARLLRGALDIASAPGEGTTLTVTVPFEASVASRAGSEGIL